MILLDSSVLIELFRSTNKEVRFGRLTNRSINIFDYL
jgi:predicted nucleic acid-binding protein